MGLHTAHGLGNRLDVGRGGATAAAHDIQPSVRGKLVQIPRAIDSGVSSKPPKAFGRPALG